MTLQKAFNLGADALKSLFIIQFDPAFPIFSNLGVTADDLMFRMTSFSVPGSGVSTKEVHWLTQKFLRPGGKIDEEKTLTLQNVRIDVKYALLQAFYDWKDQAANSYTGTIGDLIGSGMTSPFTVQPVKSASAETGTIDVDPNVGYFGFEQAWCTKVDGVDYSMEDDGFLTANLTMAFLRMSHNIGRADQHFAAVPSLFV